MAYHESEFSGDTEHTICCTGDVCLSDNIAFSKATFSGSYRNARFDGFEMIIGQVVNESYGADRGQHTFTILKRDGEKLLIKGRNLYAQGVWRKPWESEEARKLILEEKHARGEAARAKKGRAW